MFLYKRITEGCEQKYLVSFTLLFYSWEYIVNNKFSLIKRGSSSFVNYQNIFIFYLFTRSYGIKYVKVLHVSDYITMIAILTAKFKWYFTAILKYYYYGGCRFHRDKLCAIINKARLLNKKANACDKRSKFKPVFILFRLNHKFPRMFISSNWIGYVHHSMSSKFCSPVRTLYLYPCEDTLIVYVLRTVKQCTFFPVSSSSLVFAQTVS